MLVSLKYIYFVGDLLFMIPWFVLFKARRDIRLEMLVMGGVASVIITSGCYLWCTVDWWHPLTITGTRVGVEDLMFGFAIGGIAVAIFEELFKGIRERHKALEHGRPVVFISIFVFFIACTELLFSWIGLTSFYATTVAEGAVIMLLIVRHRIPIVHALLSGVVTVAVSMPIYWAMSLLSPGWIDATYYFKTLTNIRVITIPIEELVFYFTMGLLLGPLYDYWKGYRHVQSSNGRGI